MYLVNKNIEIYNVKDIGPVTMEQAKHISEVVENMMECSLKDLFKCYGKEAIRQIKGIMNMQNEQQEIGSKTGDRKRKRGMDFDGIRRSKRMRLNQEESSDSDTEDDDLDDDNPLKKYDDPLTGNRLIKPAICNCSKRKHVLSWTTWIRLMKNKKKIKCPYELTQSLTRRQLIKLTNDNFVQYKHKIVNLDQ